MSSVSTREAIQAALPVLSIRDAESRCKDLVATQVRSERVREYLGYLIWLEMDRRDESPGDYAEQLNCTVDMQELMGKFNSAETLTARVLGWVISSLIRDAAAC